MNLLGKKVELHEIKKGTTLYRKVFKEYKEVKVYEIFLERYINGWKTIIKVVDENKILYTYFANDLGMNLFTNIPKENSENE